MAILILTFATLILSYLIFGLIRNSVPEVEAGPIANIAKTDFVNMGGKVRAAYSKIIGNRKVVYRNFVVRGGCMEPRNIKDGDVISVRTFNKEQRKDVKAQLKEGQIVLIFLNNNEFHGYKMRIVKSLGEDAAITYYYENGVEKESSQPHFYKNIIGVVDEAA